MLMLDTRRSGSCSHILALIVLAFLASAATAHGWRASSGRHHIDDQQNLQDFSTYSKSKLHPDNPDLDSVLTSLPTWKAKTYEEHTGKLEQRSTLKRLHPLSFEPLAVGSIKPHGWFKQQLELMAEGLPGHLHDFYRLVKDATWGGGGQEYSILNEAWPYYLNGLVPLAFALEDERLISAIEDQLTYVLLSQHLDGWLGPEKEVNTRNFWGRYPFFLAAQQYVEAVGPDSARGSRMLTAISRFVDLMHSMLLNDYQGYVHNQTRGDRYDQQWGRSRAADMIVSLQWLYENDNARADGVRLDKDKVWECMEMIYEKAYDWSWWFRDDVYLKGNIEDYTEDVIGPLFPFLHGVNVGQGLKSPAVMGRLMDDEKAREKLFEAARRGVNLTFKYHGTSSGAIVGDERLSGNSPARGAELCSVVESMFSFSTMYQILGDKSFAEKLENAAFNALPAMVMPKWWAHQYVAQINQPYSYEVPRTGFWNVGPWGMTFGTEPNYPCCTVNFPQGYPKLLSSAWVTVPGGGARNGGAGGIAHVLLIPSEVKTLVSNDIWTDEVKIRCETNYPFTQLLTYHVEAQGPFNFSIRIPEWVNINDTRSGVYFDGSSYQGDDPQKPIQPGQPQPLKPDSHTGLHTIHVLAGMTTFKVYLSPFHGSKKPTISERPSSAISIHHGPLLYAHTISATYYQRRPANYQRPDEAPSEATDWLIIPRMEPSDDRNSSSKPIMSTPWNIALDPSTARVYEYDNLYDSSLPNPIWSEHAPPVSISVLACEIDWSMTADDEGIRGGYPKPPNESTGKTKRKHRCISRAFPIELRPYGSAKIRMAEFPVVDLSPDSDDLPKIDYGDEEEWKGELR